MSERFRFVTMVVGRPLKWRTLIWQCGDTLRLHYKSPRRWTRRAAIKERNERARRLRRVGLEVEVR
jgi:hypothetical protein